MKAKLTLFVFPICTFLFWGCNKKFKHTPFDATSDPTHCELCNYANTLEGQYRGYSHTDIGNPLQDSLTVTMQHIFLNLGPKIDSNVMYFRRTEDFDNKPTHIDTVKINTNNGNFYSDPYPSSYYNSCSMKIANDSMYIHHGVTYHFGYSLWMDFKGKKLP